jgi:hypothetical protein
MTWSPFDIAQGGARGPGLGGCLFCEYDVAKTLAQQSRPDSTILPRLATFARLERDQLCSARNAVTYFL